MKEDLAKFCLKKKKKVIEKEKPKERKKGKFSFPC